MAGHPNAPLTPEGRRRLCERVDGGRPIAHVAAEAGISRRCLAKWYARWCAHGESGLLDRSSRPATSPARTAEDIADLVEAVFRARSGRLGGACGRIEYHSVWSQACARTRGGILRHARCPRPARRLVRLLLRGWAR